MPDVISALEAGHSVPLIWKKEETTEAVIAAGYEVIYLTDHIPVFNWKPKLEAYGAHLDRLRKSLIEKPILMERLYALKGKPLRGPLDAVVSAAYWLNHYTPEQLASLADDFEVQYNAANGKAAAMLKKHEAYIKAKQAAKAELDAIADAKKAKAEKAAAMGLSIEELDTIEAAEAAAAAAEAAKLAAEKKKSPNPPAPDVSSAAPQKPKAPAPNISAPKAPAPPHKGETKIPPLRMGLSRRSKPATEGDPS